MKKTGPYKLRQQIREMQGILPLNSDAPCKVHIIDQSIPQNSKKKMVNWSKQSVHIYSGKIGSIRARGLLFQVWSLLVFCLAGLQPSYLVSVDIMTVWMKHMHLAWLYIPFEVEVGSVAPTLPMIQTCNEIPPICSLGCIRPPMNFCHHSFGWQRFTSTV